MASDETALTQKLQDLQKQLGKKQLFEEAVSSIKSLLRQFYPTASSSLRKLIYSVVCRVATILRTRYTAPGFWMAGLELFVEAEKLISESAEREHLRNCIAHAHEQLNQVENQSNVVVSSNRGFLFEGHLTVDPEPPQPQWLVQSNLLTTVASLLSAESSRGQVEDNTIAENAAIMQLIDSFDSTIPLILENDSAAPRAPPASKEVVGKLPVFTITEEILNNLGSDAECAICKENLIVDDKMQELPCKHKFHPHVLSHGWMNIIHAPFAGMNFKLMIITMKVGRRGKRRLKKRGKEQQMQFVGVNICMFR